jgi:hypothetical protein
MATANITTANITNGNISTADIDGGEIDGTFIGKNVRDSARFTFLDTEGDVILGNSGADDVTINGTSVFNNAIVTFNNGADVSGGFLELSNGTTVNEFSTDVMLSGNSDNVVPTERAVKTYVDNEVGAVELNSGSGISIDLSNNIDLGGMLDENANIVTTGSADLQVTGTGTFDVDVNSDFSGTTTISNSDITGGSIDGVSITSSDVDVTGQTLDLDDDQISGNKVEGGTIDAITINTATIGSLGGALNANNQVITNVDINSGAIDGTTIGSANRAAGNFTDLDANSTLNVAGGTTLNGTIGLGNSASDEITVTGEVLGQFPLQFEGNTNNNVYTRFEIVDPSASRTITFPNETGTVALQGDLTTTGEGVEIVSGEANLGGNAFTTDRTINIDGVNLNIQSDASETGALRITDLSETTSIRASSSSFGGTVTATGLVTANSGLNVNTGDLNVGSGNFTVAPTTGNTTVGGTLGVTGVTTLGDANITRLTAALNANNESITNANIDGGDIASGVMINKSPVVDFNSGDVRGSLTLTNLASGTGSLNIEAGAVAGTELNSSVAGAGLSGGGGSALEVNLGSGLTFSGDDIVADLSTIAGDGILENVGALDLDIDGLANAVTSIEDVDLIAIYDNSGMDEVRITREDFLENAPIGNVNIDGGTIDGATIATSDITVGTGNELDVSAGMLTLTSDQISGDEVSGGTIDGTTLDGATFTNSATFQTNVTFEEASNDLTLAVDNQASGAATVTIPDLGGTDGDMVISNATQTLSNKTLSSNTVATTQAPGTDNTTLATTAFVTDAVSTGVSGAANNVAIYDGSGDLSAEAQLATSRGGTGLSTTSTTIADGELLIGNDAGDAYSRATLTGTADQVTVSNGGGSITLSTPQDLATNSSVQFGSVQSGSLDIDGTGADNVFTIQASSDEAADVTLSIPDMTSTNDDLVA